MPCGQKGEAKKFAEAIGHFGRRFGWFRGALAKFLRQICLIQIRWIQSQNQIISKDPNLDPESPKSWKSDSLSLTSSLTILLVQPKSYFRHNSSTPPAFPTHCQSCKSPVDWRGRSRPRTSSLSRKCSSRRRQTGPRPLHCSVPGGSCLEGSGAQFNTLENHQDHPKIHHKLWINYLQKSKSCEEISSLYIVKMPGHLGHNPLLKYDFEQPHFIEDHSRFCSVNCSKHISPSIPSIFSWPKLHNGKASATVSLF